MIVNNFINTNLKGGFCGNQWKLDLALKYQPWCPFVHPRSKTIPLVPIHPFTRQIVPLVCEELLTWSSSTSVMTNFGNSHTKSFLSSKNYYAAAIFFFHFHHTLFVGLRDPRMNPRISIWNTHLVHTLVYLITHSFLHEFQPNLYQHFSYVCSTRQTTFSINKHLNVFERYFYTACW